MTDVLTTDTTLSRRVLDLGARIMTFGPRSVPADLRREHLLAVATLLFTERGYEGVSMNDVAALAGVSKPVVYDAFGSKEQLFGAVMDATHEELLRRTAEAMDDPAGEDPMFTSSRAYFAFVRDREMAWHNLLRTGPALVGEWMQRLQRRHAEFLVGRLTHGFCFGFLTHSMRLRIGRMVLTLTALGSMAIAQLPALL